MILHPHRLPLYPSPLCIYTYTLGLAGTKTAGDAHAYMRKNPIARPNGINRCVIQLLTQSRPS